MDLFLFFVQKVLGVEYVFLFSSEPKKDARLFTEAAGVVADHCFSDIRVASWGKDACARHGKTCSMPKDRMDVFIVGIPCFSSSDNNPSRWDGSDPMTKGTVAGCIEGVGLDNL